MTIDQTFMKAYECRTNGYERFYTQCSNYLVLECEFNDDWLKPEYFDIFDKKYDLIIFSSQSNIDGNVMNIYEIFYDVNDVYVFNGKSDIKTYWNISKEKVSFQSPESIENFLYHTSRPFQNLVGYDDIIIKETVSMKN